MKANKRTWKAKMGLALLAAGLLAGCSPRETQPPQGGTTPVAGAGQVPAVGAPVGSNLVPGNPVTAVRDSPNAEEVQLLQLMNEVRTKGTLNGQDMRGVSCLQGESFSPRPALAYSGVLSHAARKHATYMGFVGYMAHQEKIEEDKSSRYFYGVTGVDRMQKSIDEAGLTKTHTFMAQNSGENVSGGTPGDGETGFADALEVMKAWLDSPSHCANLMNPSWEYAGIGYVRNDTPDISTPLHKHMHSWVQVFSVSKQPISGITLVN